MKYAYLAATMILLLAGCGPTPPQQTTATANGDIVIPIRDYDAAPLAGGPSGQTASLNATADILKATRISSSKMEFLVRLEDDIINLNNRNRNIRYRNSSGGNTVRISVDSITEKLATGIPFESMRCVVEIPTSGSQRGNITWFSLIEPPTSQMVRGVKLSSITEKEGDQRDYTRTYPRYRITYKIPNHSSSFEMTVISGSDDDMKTFNTRNQEKELAYIKLNPTPDGWRYYGVALGPEASDYSFLETQSKREDFD